jgi:2-polyprenyl-3-methyl-5-hydroxy-6-metoxy-1,4-benzoquinol methylase
VRPLLPGAQFADPEGWNHGTTQAPSYSAYGRLRALLTLNLARSLNPKRVLEIAAGDAALSACLEQSGSTVVANDLRRENLQTSVAYFENWERIGILPGNAFELDPAATGQFDLVAACEIIEHVAHAADLLKHLRRFLCPGGRILLTTPNGAYFRNKLPTHSEIKDFTELETRQFKPDANGHLFLITPREMRQLAQEAGLEVERMMLWGTPFITGESGFRMLRPIPLPYYRLELLAQGLGEAIKERLCNAMTVVLR